MSQVFLSYAHEDGEFVDRLHRDLSVAGVPATYDKVALEIGDSIAEKISGIIHGAACVIGVVSSASVRSRWVQRELSWALSGELDGRSLKVLPAVIDECELPPMLTDKLFADFRRQYFPALRTLVRGIRRSLHGETHEGDSASAPGRYDRYLGDCELLERAVASADRDAVFTWLLGRPQVVASLVANPRDIVLVDPGVQGPPSSDTFVCWTPATQYLWHLVRLGPLVLGDGAPDTVWTLAVELAARVRERHGHLVDYVRRCAMADASGVLVPLVEALDRSVPGSASARGDLRAVPDRMILLAGRRQDHRDALLELRRNAKERLGVEIKSCEWLLEMLGGRQYPRYREAMT